MIGDLKLSGLEGPLPDHWIERQKLAVGCQFVREKWKIMSWETINKILGLAVVDQDFSQELLQKPLTTVWTKGFELTSKEQEVFSKVAANDLAEFSQYLLDQLRSGRREKSS